MGTEEMVTAWEQRRWLQYGNSGDGYSMGTEEMVTA